MGRPEPTLRRRGLLAGTGCANGRDEGGDGDSAVRRVLGLRLRTRTLLPVAAVFLAAAGPPTAEPLGAESCTGCHVNGAGMGVLQGRPAQDITQEMEAFRSGARPATLMNRIVKGFTPDEVAALSDWFAAQ